MEPTIARYECRTTFHPASVDAASPRTKDQDNDGDSHSMSLAVNGLVPVEASLQRSDRIANINPRARGQGPAKLVRPAVAGTSISPSVVKPCAVSLLSREAISRRCSRVGSSMLPSFRGCVHAAGVESAASSHWRSALCAEHSAHSSRCAAISPRGSSRCQASSSSV